MTQVLLDIGCGTNEFVKAFRRLNKNLGWHYLCAEPRWSGHWDRSRVAGRVECISSSYSNLRVEDESLHAVTLNAYHPMTPPVGLKKELVRTLAPGGLFISAHPIAFHPDLPPEHFSQIEFRYKDEPDSEPCDSIGFSSTAGWWGRPVAVLDLPNVGTIVYPASKTIHSRISELAKPPGSRDHSSSYLYARTAASPSIKVWVRKKDPE